MLRLHCASLYSFLDFSTWFGFWHLPRFDHTNQVKANKIKNKIKCSTFPFIFDSVMPAGLPACLPQGGDDESRSIWELNWLLDCSLSRTFLRRRRRRRRRTVYWKDPRSATDFEPRRVSTSTSIGFLLLPSSCHGPVVRAILPLHWLLLLIYISY